MTPTPFEFANQHRNLIAIVEDRVTSEGRFISFAGHRGESYGVRLDPTVPAPDDPARTIYDPALIAIRRQNQRLTMTRQYREKLPIADASQVRAIDSYPTVTDGLQAMIDLTSWCNGKCHLMNAEDPHIRVPCGGGTTGVARPGDWIVRSPNGEFSTCTAEVFAARYEPA